MQIHYTHNLEVNVPQVIWRGFSPRFISEIGNQKFYLTEKSGNQYRKIRELHIAEIDQINEAHRVLHDYLFYVRKNYELKKNYQECLARFESYPQDVEHMKGMDFNKEKIEMETYVEINRVFTNFLSSFKGFIEINEMRINRQYGAPCKKECGKCQKCQEASGGQFKLFEKTTNHCFDQYFSYAFFTQLRNYANHQFFPIEVVDFSISNLDNEKSTIDFLFDKRILIAEEYEGAKIKKKIADHPRHKMVWDSYKVKFRVLPTLLNIKLPIEILQNKIFEIEEKRYTDASNILMRFFNEGREDQREVLIISFPNEPFVDAREIRTDIIEAIRREKAASNLKNL